MILWHYALILSKIQALSICLRRKLPKPVEPCSLQLFSISFLTICTYIEKTQGKTNPRINS